MKTPLRFLNSIVRVLGVAVLLASSNAAMAQPPARPSGGGLRELGLTEEQYKRVREVRQQMFQRIRNLEASLRERRRAQEVVFADYTMDTEKAKRLNTQINDIQKDLLETHLRLQLQLRQILTAEQFNRLQQNMRRAQGRPRGQGRPPGGHRP